MNNKTLYFFSNIVSILFLVFGILNTLVAITSLIGSVTALLGVSIARSLGQEFNFPFIYGIGGGLYFGLLGLLYLASSIGLYKFKKWAYIPVIVLGILGGMDAFASLTSFSPKYFEFFWAGVYIFLGFFFSRFPNVYKN